MMLTSYELKVLMTYEMCKSSMYIFCIYPDNALNRSIYFTKLFPSIL